jgi:hypothetical protein
MTTRIVTKYVKITEFFFMPMYKPSSAWEVEVNSDQTENLYYRKSFLHVARIEIGGQHGLRN